MISTVQESLPVGLSELLLTVFVTTYPILKTIMTRFQCMKNLGTYLWPKALLVDPNFSISGILVTNHFKKYSYAFSFI